MEQKPETSGRSLHRSHSISRGLASFFTYEELQEATNNFHSSKLLGSGGYGKVYLGTLRGGQTVAVKKLYHDNEHLVEQFINEVAILSRIRHKNLVNLLGFTNPRSQELLLVYEFVPNGTVADHLHGQRSALTWDVRLQIAVEMADALVYLHSLEPPIIHCDVKTPNILLDNDLHVKVTDFSICRLLPWDATYVSTYPQGTIGYRDPECDRTLMLSDKSDVYSFGVVLLELLSGMQAVDVYREPDDIFLDVMALKKIKSFRLDDIVDSTLSYHSDANSRRMINSVAELAHECLHPEGRMRPTMVQVLRVLKDIQNKRDKMVAINVSLGLASFFTYEELQEATNNFHSSKELGSGGFGRVYLGTLRGRTVAVKKLYDDEKLVEQFFNEAAILSRIRHKNLVNLLGCTNPRNHVLLLVYEFVPNGTVADHLHGQLSALTWDLRLQIAAETADALVYLHSLEPPVIHRDVKTPNILLDNDLHVKVADFGICRLLPWDATYVSTRPQGTMGYRDPEYNRTLMLSDKSDVYSFGVVLLELLSGMQAVDVNRAPDNIFLDVMAPPMIKGNKLKELVDLELNYCSDTDFRRMINSVAELACDCLRPEGRMRPTMVQVLETLTDIQDKRYKIDDRIVNSAQAYVFSREELSQATESFRESRHLSKKIYIGNFEGLTVAVKARQVKKLREREEMLNDVKDLSQLRHDNLATLYGCTDPGSKEMLLVYEYMPNGSVGHHLHRPNPELLLKKEERIALDWVLRIRMAIETAEALSYLHSLEPPIIHRQISTYNILLDDNYHVKLSGLNPDRDSTYTFGYADPQWSAFFTSTTKYDVYSFGVVLLELISGNEAILDQYGEHAWVTSGTLGQWGSKMIQKNELDVLADKELEYHSNLDTKKMVTSVAELACKCVHPRGRMRPTMSEVLSALEQIKDGS